MADRRYKVLEPIRVVYQAPGKESGLTDVTMQIYDETGALDPTNFPDVVMTEVGSSGRYRGFFTPDQEGDWEVHISHTAGTKGHVVKAFSVGGYNVDSVGTLVNDNNAAILVVDGVVDSILAEVNLQSTQLTNIETAVDAIDSPPMIG